MIDKINEWNRFVSEATCIYDDVRKSNVRFDFKKLTKKYGAAYMDYLRAAWQAWTPECGSAEEFCSMNGNVPQTFFNKHIAV